MTLNLAALNSATKYPSIPTYHALGDRGGLIEEALEFHGDVILTEKVDGTNGRIILMPDGDWFIGSREELLTAKGDRISNPALGIVDALLPLASRLEPHAEQRRILVFFLEVYGHQVGGAARQYSGTGQVGHRLFDIAVVDPDVLDWDVERISTWRKGGGQQFFTEATLGRAAEVENIPLVPRLATVQHDDDGLLPLDIEAMYGFLGRTLPATGVALDESAGGRPEGIVLRSKDRSVIGKARFQDYERTLKRRAR